MRKVFAIPIIIVIICLLAVFMPLFIFHSVATDKNSYSAGEKVSILYSDYGFGMYCTCLGPYIEIYHLEDGNWEKISLYPPVMNYCINDTLHTSRPMPCDVIMCKTQLVNEQMQYNWTMKTFSEEGKICGNKTYTNYEEINAPKGTYKAKYGMAEAIFYIE